MQPITWAEVGLISAAAAGVTVASVAGLMRVMTSTYNRIVLGLRDDVSYHQRQLTDLRSILAAERDECEARIARVAARVEELERRQGMRE